jgi:hypothetical protein
MIEIAKFLNKKIGATIAHLAAKFSHVNLIDWILENEGPNSFKQETFNGATSNFRNPLSYL